jgi:hypothetical protein
VVVLDPARAALLLDSTLTAFCLGQPLEGYLELMLCSAWGLIMGRPHEATFTPKA